MQGSSDFVGAGGYLLAFQASASKTGPPNKRPAAAAGPRGCSHAGRAEVFARVEGQPSPRPVVIARRISRHDDTMGQAVSGGRSA